MAVGILPICLSCSLAPQTSNKISGSVLLVSAIPELRERQRGSDCSGEDYVKKHPGSQFKAGNQVIVKGSKGEIIGLGTLNMGKYTLTTSQEKIDSFRLLAPGSQATLLSCLIDFSVENLPSSDFYTIEIVNEKISISKAELEHKKYKVSLTIE